MSEYAIVIISIKPLCFLISQSFHLKVQLILDFLYRPPSPAACRTYMASWQRLPLLRCIPSLVAGIPRVSVTPSGLAAFSSIVPLLLLPDTCRVDQHSAVPEPFWSYMVPPSFLWGCWGSVDHPRMLGREPGLCNTVLTRDNALLPLHTASFSDGNTPRPVIAPPAGVVESWTGSLSGLCSEAGREEQVSAR